MTAISADNSIRHANLYCTKAQESINLSARNYRSVAATILAIATAILFSIAVPVTHPFLAGVVVFMAASWMFEEILKPFVHSLTPNKYEKMADSLYTNSDFVRFIQEKNQGKLPANELLADAYKAYKQAARKNMFEAKENLADYSNSSV